MPDNAWGMRNPKTRPVALIIDVTYDADTTAGKQLDGLPNMECEDALRQELERALGQHMNALSLPDTSEIWRSFSLPEDEPAWDVPNLDS